MNVNKIMAELERKHPGESEYLQAVREVLMTVEDAYNQHPEFEANRIAERIVEPDRTFTFKVVWVDDKGDVHYYRDQTDNYHQMNYQAIWSQLYGQNWSSNVTLHYTYGYGYYNEYKANKDYREYGLSDTKLKSDLTRKKIMENDLYGIVASINYDNKANYKATLGGGWNKYVGDHWGEVLWTKDKANGFYPGYEYYRNRAWKSDFNVYAKESWTFLPGLNAYIDLQYRHVGYRMQDPRDYYIDEDRTKGYWAHDDFDFFNPKFGINYQIDKHNRLYASYAISHKEPRCNTSRQRSCRTWSSATATRARSSRQEPTSITCTTTTSMCSRASSTT